MQIRSFTNFRNEAFYVVGFKDVAERSRLFDAISRSDVFLPSFGERMEFSELVNRLAKRDAGQVGIPGIVAAIPLRDEEMNKLLGGMTEICLLYTSAVPDDDALSCSNDDEQLLRRGGAKRRDFVIPCKGLAGGHSTKAGRGMPVEQNNQRLHIRRHRVYRNQECYADPTAGEALARIAREEQLHAQVKRIREIKYKLAWTNPAFLCSANHRTVSYTHLDVYKRQMVTSVGITMVSSRKRNRKLLPGKRYFANAKPAREQKNNVSSVQMCIRDRSSIVPNSGAMAR